MTNGSTAKNKTTVLSGGGALVGAAMKEVISSWAVDDEQSIAL
jgi:hypothetical protein